MDTTTRNADLGSMLTLLREQNARKIDVVAPASAIRSVDGRLTIRGTEPVISEDGVTDGDGVYVPTFHADGQIADKLGIPVAYLRRLREDRPDLYDANVNGILRGKFRQTAAGAREEIYPADDRSFLVRCFRGDEHGSDRHVPGIARAFLSDRYGVVDNLDVLMATLDGIREAGVEVTVDGGDLTERRMHIRFTCPAVSAMAPSLLAGYRSPFTGESGSDNPTVWAGFILSNSEVGGGAYSLTPRLVVQVCRNGMTIAKDALTKVHLGARMDAGVIRYAADTQETSLTLVKKQTRDAVQTFLSTRYLVDALTRLEDKAGEEVKTHDDVKVITKAAKFTDAEVEGILAYFTQGGQMTRGGVVNAVTAYAQTVEDGDDAYSLEQRATALLGV